MALLNLYQVENKKQIMTLSGKNIGKLIKIGITLAVFLILVGFIDLKKTKEILLNASPYFILLIFLVFLIDRIFMAWKWNILLRSMRVTISQHFAFKTYYISSFIGIVIPLGVGPDLVRFIKIKKTGLPTEKLMISIIMERILGIMATLGLTVVGLLTLMIIIESQGPYWQIKNWTLFFIATIVAGLGALFHDSLWKHTLGSPIIRRIIKKLGGGSKYYNSLIAFQKNKKVILIFILLSFIEQFFSVFAVYLGAKSLCIPLNFINCLAVVPVTVLVSRLPLSFMGIGVREGSYVLLLNMLGIDYTSAVILSILIFSLEIFFLLPAGIWALLENKNPYPYNI